VGDSRTGPVVRVHPHRGLCATVQASPLRLPIQSGIFSLCFQGAREGDWETQ